MFNEPKCISLESHREAANYFQNYLKQNQRPTDPKFQKVVQLGGEPLQLLFFHENNLKLKFKK